MSPATASPLGQDALSPLDLGFGLVLAASLGLWLVIADRLRRGAPVLPYEPRRPVPWGGIYLIVVLSIFLSVLILVEPLREVFGAFAGERPAESAGVEDVEAEKPADAQDTLRRQHPLVIALTADRSAAAVLLAVYCGVLGAAVAEEFLFRLLLQGWLEKLERRARRRLPRPRRVTAGVLPVLVASLLFAAPHVRKPQVIPEPSSILPWMAVEATARLITVVLTVWLLRRLSGATARDLGFVSAKFWADVRLGLLTFLAVGVPIYLLHAGLAKMLPKSVIPDPISLVFFALALGLLYYRTHRIVPAIVLHMALNATSIAMLLLGLAD